MSDEPDEAPAPTKKKGKLKLIAIGVLLLVGGGVGGGLYAAHSGMIGGGAKAVPDNAPKLVLKSEQKQPTAGKEGGEASATPGKPTGGPAGTGGEKYASTYYPMEKDFTANLQGSSHFIQVGIAVSTHYDERVVANLKADDIAVRSAILMALGDTTEEQVFTAQGKQQLQARLVSAINDTLKQKEGFGGISNVYFTSFVVQ